MKTNYVFIDYESVQPKDISALGAEHFHVKLFVGANQTKVAMEVVTAMHALGSRGQYVRMSGNGPNALDFHIAYYIGKLAVEDPAGYFHIISKDTGFDPLIEHLKAAKIAVTRSQGVADLLNIYLLGSMSERVDAIIADLERRGTSKPRTVKTLTNTIHFIFPSVLTEEEVALLIKELQRCRYVQIKDSNVTYPLSAAR